MKQEGLIVIVALLIVGNFIVQIATRAAMVQPARWSEEVDMLSGIQPDRGALHGIVVEPLRPEVMTPPAWALTPLASGTVVVATPMRLASPTLLSTVRLTIVPPVQITQPATSTPQPPVPPTPTPKPPVPPTPTPKPSVPSTPTPKPSVSPTPTPKPPESPSPTPKPSVPPTPVPTKPPEPPTPTPKPPVPPTLVPTKPPEPPTPTPS